MPLYYAVFPRYSATMRNEKKPGSIPGWVDTRFSWHRPCLRRCRGAGERIRLSQDAVRRLVEVLDDGFCATAVWREKDLDFVGGARH